MAKKNEKLWIGRLLRMKSTKSGKCSNTLLVKRGAKAENGLKAIIRDGCGGLGQAVDHVYGESVIDQRCIFHKLKNVRDACRTELKGDDHQEERRQLMQEAKAIYHAESAEQAKEWLATWSTRW